MGWYLTVEPVDFSFSHLSPKRFDGLVAKVKAIPDIQAKYDVGRLKIDRRSKTIQYAGSFRGGGEQVLMPFFKLVAQNLPKGEDAPRYYVCTYSDQAEDAYLQEDSEAIRYVVGPGYVTEQRMYVSLPYGEYPLYATSVTDDNPGKPWGRADIERYKQQMRGRLERWEPMDRIKHKPGLAAELSFEAELLAIPSGKTPRWSDGAALIERLAKTPRKKWVPQRELDVEDGDARELAAALRNAAARIQVEWEHPELRPRRYSLIRDVGGRDVLVTGAWVKDDEAPAEASPCDDVRLLEWAGVAAALGFVND
jgi:hypothetical protein